MKLSRLVSAAWWKAATIRALYTAAAIALPYLGGALLVDVPWVTIFSAAALGIVASLVTSLAGLPEAVGTDLPWWLAAVERTVKTFAQALAAGFVGATLLTDVPWSTVIQAAAIAALASLVRLILATLPQPPAETGETIHLGPVSITGPAIGTGSIDIIEGPVTVTPSSRDRAYGTDV